MLALPTLFDGTGSYTMSVQLDDATYNFQFNWNDRQASWFFNLLDVNGTPLVMGRKIVLNLFMIREFVGDQFPTGDLIALDTAVTLQKPGLKDLGSRVILYYLDVNDLEFFRNLLG